MTDPEAHTSIPIRRSPPDTATVPILRLDDDGNPLEEFDAPEMYEGIGFLKLVEELGIRADSTDDDLEGICEREERRALHGVGYMRGAKRFFWGIRAALQEMERHS